MAFLFYVYHIDHLPFVDKELNNLEQRSLITASLTLYAGLYYIAGLSDMFSLLLFVLLMCYNGFFIFTWLKDFLKHKISNRRKGGIIASPIKNNYEQFPALDNKEERDTTLIKKLNSIPIEVKSK